MAILNPRGSDSLPAHQPLRAGHLFDARGAASVQRDPQNHPEAYVECQPEEAPTSGPKTAVLWIPRAPYVVPSPKSA